MNNKRNITIISVIMMCIILFVVFGFSNDKELQKEVVKEITNTVTNMVTTYEMTEEEIAELPTTEILEQTEEQEKEISAEQEVESEAFEQQGEIAYNGTIEYPNVSLGEYKGLTYYSQIDSRWASKMYSSVGNSTQTIGTSGCGPTSAAMIVTATKGTILPSDMADLFLRYGYRSASNGTYWSAFRFVADTFDIGYQETTSIDTAINLLRNNNYVVASVGNGLFTTGGHFIVLTGIEGNIISVYDPYLYAGKFETSTRRGKATVSGNTVYVTVENFINYANAKGFFCYAYDGKVETNNIQSVTTATYTRYVNARIGLNVRNAPNGNVVGALANGTKVSVIETDGNWSKIGNNRWVSSNYLSSTEINIGVNNKTLANYKIGTYKVNASVLNVRYGPGTNYKAKTYNQLTANARSQNSRLGNYYTNGYKKGIICTVTKINGNWGHTPSGWICLDFCNKL